ncbi:MAG: DUF4124 domain-containing protein [Herminiimonas sp.]|nr:DUF4124 domain-containing protein [Herminiimonas sp.]
MLSVCVVLCAVAASAHAQYVWLDAKGAKQFSDMPPPASIPSKDILKAPTRATSAAGPVTSMGETSAATPLPKAPLSTAEKNADFNKRKIAQAELDKKASDLAKVNADNAKNCERAREYKRVLDSGDRIGQTDKNGDRGLMSDDQRAQESKTVKGVLDGCKS